MKIATWNVNSLRVRLPHILDWLEKEQPDILALQEIKLIESAFPAEALREAGYYACHACQKSYNGVALISKTAGADIVQDVPGLADPQRRVLAASYGDLRLLNLYVPNGESLTSEKYTYKLDWLASMTRFIAEQLTRYRYLVVVGDFNIAPEDCDVHDPEAWRDSVLCSAPERTALQKILDAGLSDTFRLFEQPEQSYSWWDYRMHAFRRNRGLRIDLILASAALCALCTSCRIDKAPRALERPSDHAPVVAEFSL